MQPERPSYRFSGALPEALAPLAARRQWLCWTYVWNEKKAKWDKPPLSAHTGRMAKGGATNPDNWGTFAKALDTAQHMGLAGVGYVLTKDDNITGADLDHCITDSGTYTPLAAEVLALGETYAEVSPSGEGVRLFMLGKYEGGVIKKDALGVEVYTWGRYLTVTGDQVGGAPAEIREAPRTLACLARLAGVDAAPSPPNGHAKVMVGDFFANINKVALQRLDAWVPALHPAARKHATGAWRVTSKDLGRDLEEDLAYHPDGIKDHGEEIGLTAVDAVLKYGAPANATDAALWLCRQTGIEPAALGFRKAKGGAKAPAETQRPAYTGPVLTVAQVVRAFRKWLKMGRDGDMALLAMLGTIAANRLAGRPVWLAIVGPPSSSKTELLDAVAHLPDIHEASSLTPAGLLSATPKKSREAEAKGGILNQIGKFGILTFKDFTSVLSMKPENLAEILAALREVYDGKWKRSVGSDGGREFKWNGKIGVILAVTEAIDKHHGVMVQMGERFVMVRIPDPGQDQLLAAMSHAGEAEGAMKAELANAVSGLFAGQLREPQPLTLAEKHRLQDLTWIIVHLRAGVDRDRIGREITQVYRPEGTSRLGLVLDRLIAGLGMIGVNRRRAFQIAEKVAFDCVPPTRLKAFRVLQQCLDEQGHADAWMGTSAVGVAVDRPTITVRRALEDLQAHGILERDTEGREHRWRLKTPAYQGSKNRLRNTPRSQASMEFD
ncbi:MAG TPA: hypothetical protein VG758_21210 [Hyphomicrobiaceae bacterium]|nr:hypothetical protein [Hyphomicrobiaceae bacterium]